MRISSLDKLFLTKHLGTLVKAGVPISEAIATVKDQAKSNNLIKMLAVIEREVENGQTLAKSLSKYKDVFDDFYISLVEAGEASGTLEQNLIFLADQLGKDYSVRKKVQSALLYPGLIVTAAVVMGGFVSWFVLPKLVDFFTAFDVKLPLSTRILLTVSTFMRDKGLELAIGIGVAIIVIGAIYQIRAIKFLWHSILIRLPFIGEIVKDGQLARFTRNLGTLLKSGLPVTDALTVTAKTMSNLKFRSDILKVSDSVANGKTILESLEKKSMPEFPRLVTRMIGVGEKSGKLDEMLLYVSEFYEEEIDNTSRNLTSLLEPILLLVIGLIVGFMALAIISPIYQLTGSISGR